MKSVLVLILLFCSSTFAGPLKVTAKDFACGHLQQLLNEQKSLIISANFFGRYNVVSDPNMCSAALVARSIYFSTKDQPKCYTGYFCEQIRYDN